MSLAVQRLREKGAFISPQIVDVAERLCLVEHVDHDRFRLENRLALFDEIYSLVRFERAGHISLFGKLRWRRRHGPDDSLGLQPDKATPSRRWV